MRQDGLFMPRLQSSRIALSEFGATMELRLVRAACLRGELAGRSWPWYDVLTVENVAFPGGLKSIGFNKKAKIMKLIAGSLLIVASAILFLAHI